MTKAEAIAILKRDIGYVGAKQLVQMNGGIRLPRDATCSGCPSLREPDGTGAFCHWLQIPVAFSARCSRHPYGPFRQRQ